QDLTGGLRLGSAELGSFEQNSFAQANAAVPEPASWAMLIGGFALVGGTLRRRRAAFV
ncbi:MAG: PEPxxWA-CTERM sorting domain-containing protein, partial [Polymorphobacter sp.]